MMGTPSSMSPFFPFLVGVLMLWGTLDATPVFTNTDEVFKTLSNIPEKTPAGNLVTTLSCSEPEHARVQLVMVKGSDLFDSQKKGKTIEIYLKRELDSENQIDLNVRQFEVYCRSPSGEAKFVTTVVVADMNDVAPQFANDNYQTEILEILEGPVPQVIYRGIKVTDGDSLFSNTIIKAGCVEVLAGSETFDCDGYFEVTETRLAGGNEWEISLIALRRVYDQLSYIVTIDCINEPEESMVGIYPNPTQRCAKRNININTKELQNMQPTFIQDRLQFTIFENHQLNTRIGPPILAYDQDTRDPNAIRFSLLPFEEDRYGYDNNFFYISREIPPAGSSIHWAAEIALNNSIDREQITGAVFVDVLAEEYDPLNRPDRPTQSARATISVIVNDINDERPKFDQDRYEKAMPEVVGEIPFEQEGTWFQILAGITVKDNDLIPFNSFAIEFIAGNEDDLFSLDHYNGTSSSDFILYARKFLLDYDLPNIPHEYTLVLQATDVNNPSLSSTTEINFGVFPVNDNKPRFLQSYSFTVPEDAAIGTVIGQIQAVDFDEGDTIMYNLLAPTFNITDDGVIILKGPLDYEKRKSYQLFVIAVDEAGNQDQTNVIIGVGDIKDVGPSFVDVGYASLLYEDRIELTPEIQVEAVSTEGDAPIRYAIENVQPAVLSPYFQMNPITGLLTIVDYINYKLTTNGSIVLEVSAAQEALKSSTTVVISVIDINNFAPEFVFPSGNNVYQITVSELVKPGTLVYTFTTEDLDGPETEAGRVVYSMVRGGFDDFNVGFDNGEVIVSSALDFDERKFYQLVVRARDNGNPLLSSTATLQVSIQNRNNKPPQFNESIIVETVKEDEAAGYFITQVTASDPDENFRLRYSLDFSSATFQKDSKPVQQFINGSQYFTIEPTTGILRLASPVLRERFDRTLFKIIVEDMNAEEGEFLPRQVASMDIRISILASDERRIYFQTNQGVVINPTLFKDLPEMTLGQAETQIFSLRAFDPIDAKDVEIYQEERGSDPGTFFEVRGRDLNGYVNLRRSVDFDTLEGDGQKQISVNVLAISKDGQRTGTATCILRVLDINDNKPIFDRFSYNFTVLENRISPWEVGTVSARDIDSSSFGQVEYMLAGANSEHFTIYTETTGTESVGVIRVAENQTLDYETEAYYILQIIAIDNPRGANSERLRNTARLLIEIVDANDNKPIFEEERYFFTVVGTTAVRGNIGIVKADDADTGANGQVEYFIEDAATQQYFGITTVGRRSARPGEQLFVGELFVKASLEDLPDLTDFTLRVYARDNPGAPPASRLTGWTTVVITVSKGVKDPKPKWQLGLPSFVDISENALPGTFVTKLTAKAATDNSSIEYEFVTAGSDDYKKFNISKTTGNIVVVGDLDYETRRTYNLLVLAVDAKNRTLTNQYLLVVRVVDEDDNKPSFLACPGKKYRVPEVTFVWEAQPKGEFVYQARACDLDTHAYNKMTYTWYFDDEHCRPSATSDFQLDEDNGRIYTKKELDREQTPDYLLCVQVEPKVVGGRRRRDAQRDTDLRAKDNHDVVLYVEVIVKDVNDNGPVFDRPFVQTVILEFPPPEIAVAEATDMDLSPNNQIRYSIDSIQYSIGKKNHSQAAAFSINGNDGTLLIGQYDYSDFVGGYFDIIVRASDILNPDLTDVQTHRVYVTNKVNQIRVIIDKPADEGVSDTAYEMIDKLNELNRMYYQIKTISYHVVDNDQDPLFEKTDVCMVVLRRDSVLTATDASKVLNADDEADIIREYGARDPGPCEPAKSIYPEGWESYWWVLVAFAIFIFILVLILIVLIICLHRQYKNYMDTRQTYLVPN